MRRTVVGRFRNPPRADPARGADRHRRRTWSGRLPAPDLCRALVGAISTYLAREVKGHGGPQILESLALRGGRIRPRVGFFGILAPALMIGSGGFVGREGPIALIGASFGSLLGQTLKLLGNHLALPVPPLSFRSPFSIVVMGILGILAGLFGIAYS